MQVEKLFFCPTCIISTPAELIKLVKVATVQNYTQKNRWRITWVGDLDLLNAKIPLKDLINQESPPFIDVIKRYLSLLIASVLKLFLLVKVMKVTVFRGRNHDNCQPPHPQTSFVCFTSLKKETQFSSTCWMSFMTIYDLYSLSNNNSDASSNYRHCKTDANSKRRAVALIKVHWAKVLKNCKQLLEEFLNILQAQRLWPLNRWYLYHWLLTNYICICQIRNPDRRRKEVNWMLKYFCTKHINTVL